FLDTRHLMYSCGFYRRPDDSLETAQEQKIDRICRKLELSAGDHVLEIGGGWGGFAVWAATRYGCRVTTTTISAQQYGRARVGAPRRRRGLAHHGAARRLPAPPGALRQDRQHRDVRGGRPRALRRLFRRGRPPPGARRRHAAADDHRR